MIEVTETPQLISKGTTKTIIQNKSNGNLYFAFTEDSDEWIQLHAREPYIFDFDIFVKQHFSYAKTEISVIKD